MFVNGEIKEARLQPSMAICLHSKREAENFFLNQSYKCWKGKAELEEILMAKSIKKLIIEQEIYESFGIYFSELTKSDTAIRKGINNNPNTEQIEKLKALCENIFNGA